MVSIQLAISAFPIYTWTNATGDEFDVSLWLETNMKAVQSLMHILFLTCRFNTLTWFITMTC